MEELERWRYPRFFADNIDTENSAIYTDSTDAKHISSVLRMKTGDKAIVCDKNGTDYMCEIVSCNKDFAEFRIIDSKKNNAEPDVEITLYQAMPKSDKLDFIVQKATELGATRVVPMITKRCVSRPDEKSMKNKLVRLRRIAYEAAKQCGRGKIPEIDDIVDFKTAVKSLDKDTAAIIFYECGGEKIKNIDLSKKKIAIFIGSEGGFEENEVAMAKENGIISAYLGERILRCETAPIVALSVLMNVTENL